MLNKTDKRLFALWGGLYILCAGLGFIPEPEDALQFLMTVLSVVFFVPGGILLYRGHGKIVRNICLISLGSTVAVLVFNVLSVYLSRGDGNLLYALLGLVSAPMFCARYWVLSLFLWACLLMASLSKTPKKTEN